MEYTEYNKADGTKGYKIELKPSKIPLNHELTLKSLVDTPNKKNIKGSNAKGDYDFDVYSLFCKDEEKDIAVGVSFPEGTYKELCKYKTLKFKIITFKVIEKEFKELGFKKIIDVVVKDEEGNSLAPTETTKQVKLNLDESKDGFVLNSDDNIFIDKLRNYKTQGASKQDMFDALVKKGYSNERANWLLDNFVFGSN